MKKYNGFANESVRKLYLCKSDITNNLLSELGLPTKFGLSYAKAVFEDCIHKQNVVWVYRGSPTDKNKRRLTPFIEKVVYYREFMKGLPYSYKTR